jgi:hypothetical protein
MVGLLPGATLVIGGDESIEDASSERFRRRYKGLWWFG